MLRINAALNDENEKKFVSFRNKTGLNTDDAINKIIGELR